jgi:hypothetical protein
MFETDARPSDISWDDLQRQPEMVRVARGAEITSGYGWAQNPIAR